MKKIYKYELPPCPGVVVTIPEKLIQPLKVDMQYGPTLWTIVDVDDFNSPTDVMAFGTGWQIPDSAREYLGSVQDCDGFVWHYFTITGE